MRFYKILFSLLLLFLIACHHDAAPDNLIEEDRFVPLMVDIHLADGYLSSKSQLPDSLSHYGNGLYGAIFKKYEVDSVQFKKSFQYYSKHLEQMGRIYKGVVNQLTAKSDSITKRLAADEMKRQRHTADSVKKAFKIDSARNAAKQDSVKKQLKVTTKVAAKDIVKKK
ncbi:MAG: DUF4296 domain-containing protein [Janthinobacterium lividum]